MYYDTLDKLERLIYENKVTILLPTIVKDEWYRNKKEAIINYTNKILKEKIKNIESLKKSFCEESLNDLNRCITSINDNSFKFEENVAGRIERVEKIFNYSSTNNIIYTDNVKQKAVQLELNKEAPFHHKDSMADALILFSAIDYVKKHKIYPAFFITENYDDFSESKKLAHKLHKDLSQYMEQYKIKYSINLAEIVNKILNNKLSDSGSSEVERELGILDELIENNEIMEIDVKKDSISVKYYKAGRLKLNIKEEDIHFNLFGLKTKFGIKRQIDNIIKTFKRIGFRELVI